MCEQVCVLAQALIPLYTRHIDRTTFLFQFDYVQTSNHNGPCVRHQNCAHVCKTEGFSSGHCRGLLLLRRCICTK
ncbi:hypothetical protein PRUPE_7G040600 [Prunus persica]|uniref:Knottins-like domain-containing protein n=1 Tax=Prunus persica TaxID=3760 RepID=M5VSJ8_PRUPE|nr:hypothetical protein PRUPE_7G040600 [Prunus persica]